MCIGPFWLLQQNTRNMATLSTVTVPKDQRHNGSFRWTLKDMWSMGSNIGHIRWKIILSHREQGNGSGTSLNLITSQYTQTNSESHKYPSKGSSLNDLRTSQ